MQIAIAQPNANNVTTLTTAPDTGLYALVTLDGAQAGTYSVLLVPPTGWDDTAVTAAALAWFQLEQQAT